jgi:hypothetical protein
VLHDPGAVPSLPKAGDPDAYTLGAADLVLFLVIAQRAVRTFSLTRRTTDLVVVVGAVWLGVALYPALLLAPGGWGWWMGHLLEFLGVALVGIPLAVDARRGAPSHPTAGDLPAERLVAEAESFLGGEVRALLHRLDRHDRSTEEHTRRVATWAVALGEPLGLRGGRLRELALAGILHDIGKLSVPHAILAKPGRLTDEEMDVIRCHPAWGEELLAQLGQPERIRRWVRGHHERLDGSGYPDGLEGSCLDLETRILGRRRLRRARLAARVPRGVGARRRAGPAARGRGHALRRALRRGAGVADRGDDAPRPGGDTRPQAPAGPAGHVAVPAASVTRAETSGRHRARSTDDDPAPRPVRTRRRTNTS